MGLDIDKAIEKCLQRETLDELLIRVICEKVKELLIKESNVHQISSPVTVVGDVHG